MDTEKPQTAAQWVKQYSKHVRNTRLVLRELADFIDDSNDCPSHTELAEKTGLTKPTIQHALKELEKDGTIRITRHGGGVKRGGKKNCYALPGMDNDPVKPFDPVKEPGKTVLPGKNDPVKPALPGQIQPGKESDDLPHEQHETGTSEYVRTRGDAPAPVFESVSQKQKDRQTDSKPVANLNQISQSVEIPANQKAKDAFEGNIGVLTAAIATELTGHVALYGIDMVMVAIANAATKQRKEGLRDPMMYIRQALANMALERKVFSTPTPAPMPYSPTTAVPSVAPAPVKVHPKQISQPVNREVVKVDPEGFKRKILERRAREKENEYVPGSHVQRGS